MNGLFIGMVTLDLIYRVDRFPNQNEKIAALDCAIAAGGPATNAAVAFAALGGKATLVGAVGRSPQSQVIRGDLATHQVQLLDLAADPAIVPPVSSIIVTQPRGDRAVVSLDGSHVNVSAETLPGEILQGVEVILFDGHQLELSRAIAALAKAKKIPTAIDCGSWKPGLETLLPWVDYALCSADFYPPNCASQSEVFAYLNALDIPHIAITAGEKPIHYCDRGQSGAIEIPTIQAVDTLGAGDIFHGGFCHSILQRDFIESLSRAAQIAAFSCRFFGTRVWIEKYPRD